jgi:hydroxyethylthiazole kinase-like uncharacterized protein yjeF
MSASLYTVNELRAIEQAAQRGLPHGELMARAGRGAARRIDEIAGSRSASVCIVAGPGNNGGDGFVVARELAARGHDVACVLIGAPQPTASDALAAFKRWRDGGGSVLSALPERRFGIVVDGLFGIGLTRPLQGAFLDAARWINTHAGRVVALDVPSGLDSDRGAWVGEIEGVLADVTVTFIGDKPGLHTGAGIDAAGAIHVDVLGLDMAAAHLQLSEPGDFVDIAHRRRRDTHKGSFGSVLVLGGGAGMVGAPLLAARGTQARRRARLRRLRRCAGAPGRSSAARADVPAACVARRDRVHCGGLRTGLG